MVAEVLGVLAWRTGDAGVLGWADGGEEDVGVEREAADAPRRRPGAFGEPDLGSSRRAGALEGPEVVAAVLRPRRLEAELDGVEGAAGALPLSEVDGVAKFLSLEGVRRRRRLEDGASLGLPNLLGAMLPWDPARLSLLLELAGFSLMLELVGFPSTEELTARRGETRDGILVLPRVSDAVGGTGVESVSFS